MHTRKTDLLPKFMSKKGRPFSAYLVTGPDGKVGFEFEPKKAKAKAAGTPPETATQEPKSKVSTSKKPLSRKRNSA